jgi:hypothetical protein
MGRDQMKGEQGGGVKDSIQWDETEWAPGAQMKWDEPRTPRENEVTVPCDLETWEEIKQNTARTRDTEFVTTCKNTTGLCIVSVK